MVRLILLVRTVHIKIVTSFGLNNIVAINKIGEY